MSKLPTTAVAAIALVSFAGIAHADQTFTFTGIINRLDGAPLVGVQVGDTFTQVFTIRSGATNVAAGGPNAIYESSSRQTPGDVKSTFSFDSYTVTTTSAHGGLNHALAANDQVYPSTNDNVLEEDGQYGTGSGFTNVLYQVYLGALPTQGGAKPFTSVYPTIEGPGLTDLSQWTINQGSFQATTSAGSRFELFGTITGITVAITPPDTNPPPVATVPEPAPIAAFGLGLLGVLALALRKRKNVSIS